MTGSTKIRKGDKFRLKNGHVAHITGVGWRGCIGTVNDEKGRGLYFWTWDHHGVSLGGSDKHDIVFDDVDVFVNQLGDAPLKNSENI